MAKRRNKQEQINDLLEKQKGEQLRTRARAGNEELKTLLHRREYARALEAIDELHDVVTLLAEDTVPVGLQAVLGGLERDGLIERVTDSAPAIDRKSAAAGER